MPGEIRVGFREALVAVSVVGVAILVYVVAAIPLSGVVVGSFVLTGVLVLYLSVGKLRRSLQRGEFVPVDARVLRSELRSQEEIDSGARATAYFPQIEYEYTVDGETYTSDSVYPGRLGGTSNHADNQAVVENHPEGERVEAYYHPDDPSRSFLVDRSSTRAAIFGIVASLGMIAVGGYGLWILFG